VELTDVQYEDERVVIHFFAHLTVTRQP